MTLTIDSTNRIKLDGQDTGLSVTQEARGTIVYTPEKRADLTPYKEHRMPRVRYSLAHKTPASGVPGYEQFEADLRLLLQQLTTEGGAA